MRVKSHHFYVTPLVTLNDCDVSLTLYIEIWSKLGFCIHVMCYYLVSDDLWLFELPPSFDVSTWLPTKIALHPSQLLHLIKHQVFIIFILDISQCFYCSWNITINEMCAENSINLIIYVTMNADYRTAQPHGTLHNICVNWCETPQIRAIMHICSQFTPISFKCNNGLLNNGVCSIMSNSDHSADLFQYSQAANLWSVNPPYW